MIKALFYIFDMKEIIRKIKHEFMTYRNGIIADQLRSAGMDCYTIIFGLNVPQIAQISRSLNKSLELADMLWADKHVRESRLLATYIFPTEMIDDKKACNLIEDLQTREEADMLCFRLLKQLSFAPQIIKRYECNENEILSYCASSLKKHTEQ